MIVFMVSILTTSPTLPVCKAAAHFSTRATSFVYFRFARPQGLFNSIDLSCRVDRPVNGFTMMVFWNTTGSGSLLWSNDWVEQDVPIC